MEYNSENSESSIKDVRVDSATITILSDEQDGKIVLIKFVDGKKYKLQHPGVRTYYRWKEEAIRIGSGKMSFSYIFEQALKHCVFAEDHNFKPDMDNLSPRNAGLWDEILRQFLDGTLYTP